jgi:hypothetical protein
MKMSCPGQTLTVLKPWKLPWPRKWHLSSLSQGLLVTPSCSICTEEHGKAPNYTSLPFPWEGIL